MGEVPIDTLETKLAKLSANRRREVEDFIDLLNGEVGQNNSTIPDSSSRRAPRPWPPDPRQIVKKTIPAPETNLSPPREDVSSLVTRSPKRGPGSLAGPKNPVKKPRVSIGAVNTPVLKKDEIPASDTAQTDFENELDTLNSKNLDLMRGKIRKDCKTIIKHLHLDHLLDND